MSPPLDGDSTQGRGPRGKGRETFRRGTSLPIMSAGEREGQPLNYRNHQQENPPTEERQQQDLGQTIPSLEGINVGALRKLLATSE